MSDTSEPITPKINPEDLEIRAKPRPVTRINRRVLYLLSGTGLILIFGATIFALNPPSVFDKSSGGSELYNIDNKPSADGLEGLPRKYSDLSKPPELGPPLPGDLGSAILKVERDLGIQPTPALPFRPNPEEDAERAERIRQARLAQQGRESGVFFQLALRNSGALPDTSTKLAATSANASSGNPFDAISVAGSSTNTSLQLNRNNDQNLQGRKLDFLNQKANGKIYNPHKLQTPASPYQIMAGTIISASLITGINSDLPGNVIAQVTENVYDTATGGHLWIPQGSRMMGTYDSVVAFGQERALLVWQRIILPDGSSIVIDNLPGTDTAGYAGLEDKVNFHTWKLLKGIVLSTLPSIPHLRLLLICVKCTLTILHDLHSIFPKRLKCCVDPLKPPVNAELKSALQDYAEIYRQTYGGKETLADLIPFILESFISADHGFKRARRELTNLRPSSLSNQERET